MPKLPTTTTDAAATDTPNIASRGLAPDQMPGLPATFWIGMAVAGAFYVAVLLGVIWLLGVF